MSILFLCLLVASACALPARTPGRYGEECLVGGQEASPGQFPYQLSLSTFGFHFCGASILDANTAITSCTCIDGSGAIGLEIVAGKHSISQDDGTEQTIGVAGIIAHEEYDSRTFYNDIALLKLESSISFDSYAQPVELPSQGQETTASTCTVTGWGSLSCESSSYNSLQYVDSPILSDEDCSYIYGESDIADSLICAEDEGGDTCQADSGGPVYCDGYQAGIVSWGYGCAGDRNPRVYTKVAYFIDWINANA